MSVQHRKETAYPWEPLSSQGCLAQPPFLKGDIAVGEFLLLLPVCQARALEAAAHRRGLTVGQMARHIIRDFLTRE